MKEKHSVYEKSVCKYGVWRMKEEMRGKREERRKERGKREERENRYV